MCFLPEYVIWVISSLRGCGSVNTPKLVGFGRDDTIPTISLYHPSTMACIPQNSNLSFTYLSHIFTCFATNRQPPPKNPNSCDHMSHTFLVCLLTPNHPYLRHRLLRHPLPVSSPPDYSSLLLRSHQLSSVACIVVTITEFGDFAIEPLVWLM
jgi:hypothetical protein